MSLKQSSTSPAKRKGNWTHGQSGTPTWRTWKSMKERCRARGGKSFVTYASRGIRVCARWEKFENFLADMGPRPAGLTLDRIDNRKGYTPTNCRWATVQQQNVNRSVTVFVSHEGERISAAEYARRTGTSVQAIYKRIQRSK